jgi:hypothetical protein
MKMIEGILEGVAGAIHQSSLMTNFKTSLASIRLALNGPTLGLYRFATSAAALACSPLAARHWE